MKTWSTTGVGTLDLVEKFGDAIHLAAAQQPYTHVGRFDTWHEWEHVSRIAQG